MPELLSPSATRLWDYAAAAPDLLAPGPAWHVTGTDLSETHRLISVGVARATKAGWSRARLASMLGMTEETLGHLVSASGHVRVRPSAVAALLHLTGAVLPDPFPSCLCQYWVEAGDPAEARRAHDVETGWSPQEENLYRAAALGLNLDAVQVRAALAAGSVAHGPARNVPRVPHGSHTLWRRVLHFSGWTLPEQWLVAAPEATLADLSRTLDSAGKSTPWQWVVHADGIALHPLSVLPDGIARDVMLDLTVRPDPGAKQGWSGACADPAAVPLAAVGVGGSVTVMRPENGERVGVYTLVDSLTEDVARGDRLCSALVSDPLRTPLVWTAGGPAVDAGQRLARP